MDLPPVVAANKPGGGELRGGRRKEVVNERRREDPSVEGKNVVQEFLGIEATNSSFEIYSICAMWLVEGTREENSKKRSGNERSAEKQHREKPSLATKI